MSGALLELIATGGSDSSYYTNEKEDKYFQPSIQKHNKFSSDTKVIPIDQSKNIKHGSDNFNEVNAHMRIDLIESIYLEFYLPLSSEYQKLLPYFLFENVEIYSVGNFSKFVYSKMEYAKFLLGHKETKDIPEILYSENPETLVKWSTYGNSTDANGNPCVYLRINLGIEKYISVLAMNKSEFRLKFKNLADVTCNVLVKAIHICQESRPNYYGQNIIIRQNQFKTFVKPQNSKELRIRLCFEMQLENLFFIFTDLNGNIYQKNLESFITMEIQLNGHSREENKTPSFYRYIQPSYVNGSSLPSGIYFYSFSNHTDNQSHSSSLNASRIDNLAIYFTFLETEELFINVYATNLSILNTSGFQPPNTISAILESRLQFYKNSKKTIVSE